MSAIQLLVPIQCKGTYNSIKLTSRNGLYGYNPNGHGQSILYHYDDIHHSLCKYGYTDRESNFASKIPETLN